MWAALFSLYGLRLLKYHVLGVWPLISVVSEERECRDDFDAAVARISEQQVTPTKGRPQRENRAQSEHTTMVNT